MESQVANEWLGYELATQYTDFAPGIDSFEGYNNQGWLSPEVPEGIEIPRNLRRQPHARDSLATDHFLLNVGPSHPATHGALRMIMELDGEKVMGSEAHVGYLHRGLEKLAEHRKYSALGTIMDRGDYAGGILAEWAMCRAVEDLGEIEVPERAEWIRTLVAELNRLASHYIWLAAVGVDTGAMGPFLYMLRDREAVLEVLEAATGSRMMYNYLRPGGVVDDWPLEADIKLEKYLEKADEYLDEHWDSLYESELFKQRLINVGIVPHNMALSFAGTGFVARSCGIDWDLRRDRPYGYYDKLEFDVLVLDEGDTWARVLVRYDEMKQSIRMIKQLVEMGIPEGDFTAKVPKVLRLPKGEAYGYVEGVRGELGCHIYSDGGPTPYRMRYRPPIQYNLAIAETTIPGGFIADAMVTMASFDFCFGEVDR